MALLTRPKWLWRIVLAVPAVACWAGAARPTGTDADAVVDAVEGGEWIIEVFDRCIVVGPIPVASVAQPEPEAAQAAEPVVDTQDDTTVLPPPVDAELTPFAIEFPEMVACSGFLSADPSTAAEVSLRLTTFLARYNGWATTNQAVSHAPGSSHLVVALWCLAIPLSLLGLPLLNGVRVAAIRFVRCRRNRCVHCGYSLIGLPGPRCPECGHEIDVLAVAAALAHNSR